MKKLDFLEKLSHSLLPFLISLLTFDLIQDQTLIGFFKTLGIVVLFIAIRTLTLDVFIRDRLRLRAVLAKADKDVQDWGKK